jgi:hypothetical protein
MLDQRSWGGASGEDGRESWFIIELAVDVEIRSRVSKERESTVFNSEIKP